MDNLAWIVIPLVAGLLLGAAAGWSVAVARARADRAGQSAETERLKADAAAGRAEAAQARAEAARVVADVALARGETADARADAAAARSDLAQAKAAAAGAAAQRDAARERADEVARDREDLMAKFRALSAEVLEHQGRKADETAEQRLKATEALLTPVKESLERFNARLVEVEKERVAMTTELRGQVGEVKATGEALRRETSALVTALRKPQVRGSWGELQLKRVAETAGMLEHCDFIQQATTTTTDATIRPDMKILFSDAKFVYVDAKTPLTGFLDAYETDDETRRREGLQRFAANVRAHVDQLSHKRYFAADSGTPEFVVLFLPSEALGAEAFAQLPDLFDYATARNIVIATPTTLIAILRSIAYSWKQAALTDSARDVFELGRELYRRLGKLGSHFDKLGRSLTSAVSAYNGAVGCVEGRVLATARRFRDLGVGDPALAEPRPNEVPVRALSAPELVEDANSLS